MNVLQLKYAVEVANTGSISKAAENLYMNQPNLSRAIKELEGDLGISIFERTPRGMAVTFEGEEFLSKARSILSQFKEIEEMFPKGKESKYRFSISVPRSSYISHAFTEFTKKLPKDISFEFYYRETNAMRAINNLLHVDYKLAVIRYSSNYEHYYNRMLVEKDLSHKVIAEFKHSLIMSKNHPLANNKIITEKDLEHYTEIAHADPFVPSLSITEVKKEELAEKMQRRIFVFERGSQFTLLSENTDTFMWVSPTPPDILERYGLIERKADFPRKTYKDILIYKKDYKLSKFDNLFIDELCNSKKMFID